MINYKSSLKFCKDDISKIENYEKAIADTSHTWDLHHRLELTLDGEFAHSAKELRRLGMYYHRPYFELIFLPQAEHIRLHNKLRSTESSKNMITINTNFWKGKAKSAEQRKKISDALKGKPKSLAQRQYMKDVAKEFRLHKASGGTMTWNEFQSSFKANISEI